MSKVVGMSLKTKQEWLNAALDQLIQKNDDANIRTFLDEYIKDELPGKQYRDKVLGIVQRIWINVPPERIEVRNRAIALAQQVQHADRLWLHWGMALLAYPFFRDAVQVIGRLTLLQSSIQTVQIHARMVGNWGDRITTKDAVQRMVTTLIDWEILVPTLTKGEFILTEQRKSANPEVQLWLLYALSVAYSGHEVELQQLLRMPEIFPFQLTIGPSNIRRYDGFDIHRQGGDMEMVSIHQFSTRKSRSPGLINEVRSAGEESAPQSVRPKLSCCDIEEQIS